MRQPKNEYKIGQHVSDGFDEGNIIAVGITPKELLKQNQDFLVPIAHLGSMLPADRFIGGGHGNILDTSYDPIVIFKTAEGELVAVFEHEVEEGVEEE